CSGAGLSRPSGPSGRPRPNSPAAPWQTCRADDAGQDGRSDGSVRIPPAPHVRPTRGEPRIQMNALSIIIPAHQEAGWIESTLESLLHQDFDKEVDAIVVANGCTDDTAVRARAFQQRFAARRWRLTVAELSKGGKPGALNHGDDLARHA